MPAVIAEASVNPEMRAVLGAFVRDRRQRPRAVVIRGIERGQLRPDTDVELLLDLLGGTVFYRELVSGEPADEEFVGRLLDVVLAAFT
jgi:hypothetical protein